MKKILSKIFKKSLNSMPTRLRNELVRRTIRLPLQLTPNLVFKIVETEAELEASFRLVYESYLKLGYCEENSHKMRGTIHHALSTTTTLIAIDAGRVVGTLTIVRDNRHGLPLEKVFEVKHLRGKAHRLAEITSLVIHPDYRREKGGQILFPLLHLMYHYSTNYFGVNHLLVAIHPKDVFFYESLLLFSKIEKTGVENYYGAPAVTLSLDLKNAVGEYERTYSKRNRETNLHTYFMKMNFSNICFPERPFHKIHDPLVSVQYFEELFVGKLNLPKHITGDRRNLLASVGAAQKRIHQRVETNLSVELVNEEQNLFILGSIKDVSKTGFRVYSEQFIPFDTEFTCVIEIADRFVSRITAKVNARPIWNNSNLGIGFEIDASDKVWNEFIDYLTRDQQNKAA